jgi:hypothetical protein
MPDMRSVILRIFVDARKTLESLQPSNKSIKIKLPQM